MTDQQQRHAADLFPPKEPHARNLAVPACA
jgi:hypothetical protein